jgi:hypothetical protein
MAQSSIKTRIKDLLQDITVDNIAIGQFATDAAKEIINVLPIEMLWSISTYTPDLAGAGASITSSRILYAARNSYRAVEIDAANASRATDANSIYKATNESPVFYKEGGKVYIKPVVSSGNDARVHHVNYPTIAFDSDLSTSGLVGAPDEIEHLIILKTAVKARLSELNEYQDDTEEHNLKLQDLQLLQAEYQMALATFIGSSGKKEAE